MLSTTYRIRKQQHTRRSYIQVIEIQARLIMRSKEVSDHWLTVCQIQSKDRIAVVEVRRPCAVTAISSCHKYASIRMIRGVRHLRCEARSRHPHAPQIPVRSRAPCAHLCQGAGVVSQNPAMPIIEILVCTKPDINNSV